MTETVKNTVKMFLAMTRIVKEFPRNLKFRVVDDDLSLFPR